jgi:hypothetical protein
MTPIRFPKELGVEGRKFYAAILRQFDADAFGAHDMQLLRNAAAALDRISEAQAEIKSSGSYFIDRWGAPKPHPGHAVERDNRILFARLCRELNLSCEKPEDPRPPGLYK